MDPAGKRLKIPVWMLLPESAEIKISQQPHLGKQALLSLASLIARQLDSTQSTMSFGDRALAEAREVVVVQLQLLDLMISRECGAVPMDAATRADLIDLTARVIAAVFHEEGRRGNDRALAQSQNQTGASGLGQGGARR